MRLHLRRTAFRAAITIGVLSVLTLSPALDLLSYATAAEDSPAHSRGNHALVASASPHAAARARSAAPNRIAAATSSSVAAAFVQRAGSPSAALTAVKSATIRQRLSHLTILRI